MNQVRTFLLFAWLLVGFLIWEAWQRDYVVPPTVTPTPTPAEGAPPPIDAAAVPTPTVPGAVPDATVPGAVPDAPRATPLADTPADLSPVVVSTDRLRLAFDPRGAMLVRSELLDYGLTPSADSQRVELFSTTPGRFFVAQAGWWQPHPQQGWQPLQGVDAIFEAQPTRESGGVLEVPFLWRDEASGLTLERTWLIARGGYLLSLRDRWRNTGEQPATLAPHRDLLREPPPVRSGFTNPEAYSYVGAAWYSPQDKFNKIKFDDFGPRQGAAIHATGGWVAMLQHYFFAAWIPAGTEATIFSTSREGGYYRIRTTSGALTIPPGESIEHETRMWVGPKLQGELADVAPGLELVIDYGIFTVLSKPLFWLLAMFHSWVGNWGWAIILLVVLIKAVFFKLSETQYRSFAKMRRVQPRIEALKERYGDDRQKFNAAMMELYQKEKINPMGGCLPILVQIPVFIALYWVLLESVELRHAPWFGWIQNLSAPDPYFILPALNLVIMWATQKLSPAPGMDPLQKKIMQAMPIVFGVLFAFFPAGLVLYWTVNGALGLLQQWVIIRRHGEQPAKA